MIIRILPIGVTAMKPSPPRCKDGSGPFLWIPASQSVRGNDKYENVQSSLSVRQEAVDKEFVEGYTYVVLGREINYDQNIIENQ